MVPTEAQNLGVIERRPLRWDVVTAQHPGNISTIGYHMAGRRRRVIVRYGKK